VRNATKRGNGRPVVEPLFSASGCFGGSTGTGGFGGATAGTAVVGFAGGGFSACGAPCGRTTGGDFGSTRCTGSRGAVLIGVGGLAGVVARFGGNCSVPVGGVGIVWPKAADDATSIPHSSRRNSGTNVGMDMDHGCQVSASRVKHAARQSPGIG
jgi:hypothetical protein